MMKEDCIFCRIAKGEVESRKIYDDGDILGLVDINPRFGEGQCVVFPKTHKEQFYHLDDEELSRLFIAVKKVAKKIKEVYDSEYVSIFTRGQTLEHLHVILFPAGTGNVMDKFIEMMITYEGLRKTDDEDLDRIQEMLRID